MIRSNEFIALRHAIQVPALSKRSFEEFDAVVKRLHWAFVLIDRKKLSNDHLNEQVRSLLAEIRGIVHNCAYILASGQLTVIRNNCFLLFCSHIPPALNQFPLQALPILRLPLSSLKVQVSESRIDKLLTNF